MLENFFCWPDQLPKHSIKKQPLVESARLLRLQDFVSAESLLLSRLAEKQDVFQVLIFLCFLRLRFAQLSEADQILESLIEIDAKAPQVRFLIAQYCLQTSQILRTFFYP